MVTPENTTYAYFSDEFPSLPHTCLNCKHWDAKNMIRGFATCDKLVYGNTSHKLGTRSQVEDKSCAIVKSWMHFECKWFEMKEGEG